MLKLIQIFQLKAKKVESCGSSPQTEMVLSHPKSGFWCRQISNVVTWHAVNLNHPKKSPGCWTTFKRHQGVRQWELASSSCCGSPWPWGYAACSGYPGLETPIGDSSHRAQPVWRPVLFTREQFSQILSGSTQQSAFLQGISIVFIKLGQKTLKQRAVNWISQGSIASSRGLSLASLFPSLQHNAAVCCPHYFKISLGDWERSMTFLFFLPYWREQILIPWKYLSLWACLYKFSPWFLQVICCELDLESPGRERSQSDPEEAGSPSVFMYEMFQVVLISKKSYLVVQQLGNFFARVILP